MDKKNIMPFNWRSEVDNLTGTDRLDNDFILLDNPIITSVFKHPFRADVTTAMISLRGSIEGFTNLKPYSAQPPCLFIILPGQILEYTRISDDFKGLFIVMSGRFTESLNIEDRISFHMSVKETPNIPLDEEGAEAFVMYYRMMQKIIRQTDNPNRLEVARLLTKAFFYGAGYYLHNLPEENAKSKQELLAEKFLRLVETNYKRHRDMDFYADKLCLTVRHIATVIKNVTGKSAVDWIDDYVTLEAKALLKSTNMTVQQISDELNFPSQSFFGKYFKRVVGVSPKEYRARGA